MAYILSLSNAHCLTYLTSVYHLREHSAMSVGLFIRSLCTLAPAALYIFGGRLDATMRTISFLSGVVSFMELCVLLYHNIFTNSKLADTQSVLPQQHDHIASHTQQLAREHAFLQALTINKALHKRVQQEAQINVELREEISDLTDDVDHFRKELSRRDLECRKLNVRNLRAVPERNSTMNDSRALDNASSKEAELVRLLNDTHTELDNEKRRNNNLAKKLSLLETEFSNAVEKLSRAVTETEEAQAALAEMKGKKEDLYLRLWPLERDRAKLYEEVGNLMVDVEDAQECARSEKEAFRSLQEKTDDRIRYLEEKVAAKDGLLASVRQDAKDASAFVAQRDAEIRSLKDQLVRQGLQNCTLRLTEARRRFVALEASVRSESCNDLAMSSRRSSNVEPDQSFHPSSRPESPDSPTPIPSSRLPTSIPRNSKTTTSLPSRIPRRILRLPACLRYNLTLPRDTRPFTHPLIGRESPVSPSPLPRSSSFPSPVATSTPRSSRIPRRSTSRPLTHT
ncbi:hypothetical protein C8Q80DRAFT_194925 [Daedaleopsis nitida]|nr:hypothetical protein C8Q80DRAFT_194925 [Daedaleopsis nitida]